MEPTQKLPEGFAWIGEYHLVHIQTEKIMGVIRFRDFFGGWFYEEIVPLNWIRFDSSQDFSDLAYFVSPKAAQAAVVSRYHHIKASNVVAEEYYQKNEEARQKSFFTPLTPSTPEKKGFINWLIKTLNLK